MISTLENEVVLVTGHGMWLRQALGMLNKDEQLAKRIKEENLVNGSISVVTYTKETGFIVRTFNQSPIENI